MDATRTGPRVRAPELSRVANGDWFNSPGPLTLAGLRGRFVLLDFWTFCCGNCLHVLDELRPLEATHADVLTVIGVHSPKFPHEAEPAALAAAIERYEVHHPVLNDPELRLWRQYAVKAWPTLVLVDPEGYVVAQAAGEGQVSALAATLDVLVAEHEAKGTLAGAGDGPYEPPPPRPSTLRFPARAIVLPSARTGRDTDTLLVADAGHHQLVELAPDGETELRRFGTGRRGEPFAEPNGLTLLPPGRAPYDVLVADTANHVLRGIRLADGAVSTLDLPAALADARTVTGAIPAVLSPWDVAWWPALDRAVVAAAGVHLLLAVDIGGGDDGTAQVLAGTTVEGLRDGPAGDAWLAQPSGLAIDGDRLWFVDAETSALRWLDLDFDLDGTVHTAVGEGLFDFGHVDGPAGLARLQHPLGVNVLPDHRVAILDTYNGAVRRYDPATHEVATLARGLAEPSGALVLDGELVVVESAAHRLVRPLARTDAAPELVSGDPQQLVRTPTALRPGTVELVVGFQPPPGRKVDDRFGPAVRLSVSAAPPGLLRRGAGESGELHRTLQLAAVEGDAGEGDAVNGGAVEGVLQVTAQVASCDEQAEHPACYLARQDWGIPVRLDPTGADRVELVLLD